MVVGNKRLLSLHIYLGQCVTVWCDIQTIIGPISKQVMGKSLPANVESINAWPGAEK